MRTLSGLIYRNLIKRFLFLFPADYVHELFLWKGRLLGKVPLVRSLIAALWRFDDPMLEQRVLEFNFTNPIGLSAGFDYNADLVDILPSIGFGFNTIGTLTHSAYSGNPPPMLGRLPKSRSLLVNKGFKNKSIKVVLARLSHCNTNAIRGVSIGATNKPYEDFVAMIADIKNGFLEAEKCKEFDYYELNISCPNLLNLKNLKRQIASPEGLTDALSELKEIGITRPVFIKMPLERSDEEIKELIEVAIMFPFVVGLIIANLAKNRENPAFDKDEIAKAGVGNFSGKPVAARANELLRFAYQHYQQRLILIGAGGVFSSEDAYEKIRSGATLVQMITGMIYMGPQVVGEINQGLIRLLKKDGYHNISEAIGADLRVVNKE